MVMKSILPASASTLCSIALGFAALVSVQNAQSVIVMFLGAQSVPLPLGLVLIFCTIVGLIGGTIGKNIWQLTGRKRMRKG
jgi:uncharacterized integral membrane protein